MVLFINLFAILSRQFPVQCFSALHFQHPRLSSSEVVLIFHLSV